ncbi:MAG: NAD(P)-binding protein [Anaerolineae bacterium]|nr:NAD(P)-binding protein [Anaerolineae bacterium]
MSSLPTRVNIFGAGLAGLVAAINLVRNGFEVHIFDHQHRIGGNPHWHPSVQTTVLNPERTWEYIGIDLSHCFRPVDSITLYRYGGKKVFSLKNMYVCERGPRQGSLDSFLYEMAASSGVQFHLLAKLEVNKLEVDHNNIIATGLETEVYEQLGIPYVPIYGYRGVIRTELDAVLISYMLKCTNYDFAYLAAGYGLLFALLFSRKKLDSDNLQEFQQTLKDSEGIEFKKWIYSTGAVPTKTHLFYNGLVLAGTLSGMIDPFLLHGISGALTSGKIAAQTFVDREGASREFHLLAKNFVWKKGLKEVSTWIPFKNITFPVMMWTDAHLRGVGFVPFSGKD